MITAAVTRAADLATLTDDDLAELFALACNEANSELQRVILAVAEKRDRAAAYWRERNARTAALRAEWRDAAYAQYLAAESECKGELVCRDSRIADPFDLWSGSERFAYAHASEELRNFWLVNPRVTVTAYLTQHADGQEIYRDDIDRAALDACPADTATEGGVTDDRVARDESVPVRRDASAGRENPPVCGDGRGHHVSRPDARGAGTGSAGSVPGRHAGIVRGPVTMRDSADGARVDLSRGGEPAGYAFRVQVKAGGFLRYAWWGVRADGSMFLRPDKRAAVREVLA